SVDGEVDFGRARRPIMGRLRGSVNDSGNRTAMIAEEIFDRPLVTDIGVEVLVPRYTSLKHPSHWQCSPFRSEEGLSHVVVDTNNIEAFLSEEAHCLRSDKAGGAGDDHDAHDGLP